MCERGNKKTNLTDFHRLAVQTTLFATSLFPDRYQLRICWQMIPYSAGLGAEAGIDVSHFHRQRDGVTIERWLHKVFHRIKNVLCGCLFFILRPTFS